MNDMVSVPDIPVSVSELNCPEFNIQVTNKTIDYLINTAKKLSDEDIAVITIVCFGIGGIFLAIKLHRSHSVKRMLPLKKK